MASKKVSKKKGKPKVRGKRGLTLVDVKDLLVKEFGDTILEFGIVDKGKTKILALSVRTEEIVPMCKYLQDEGFEHCSMISAVDWKDRFEIVYHISSIKNNLLLQITVQLPHDRPIVDSVSNIWGGANWHEREAWDLMGITFRNHPKLKRILLPEDFVGHPLRKDYKEVS